MKRMSGYVVQRFDNVPPVTVTEGGLRREATTVATATTQRVFATNTTAVNRSRTGVSINNLDSSAFLFVTLVPKGGSAPTISTTACDFIIGPRTDRSIPCGIGVDVYIRSDSAGSVNYQAMEVG